MADRTAAAWASLEEKSDRGSETWTWPASTSARLGPSLSCCSAVMAEPFLSSSIRIAGLLGFRPLSIVDLLCGGDTGAFRLDGRFDIC